jgi:DTW domain-containing protein YfiP
MEQFPSSNNEENKKTEEKHSPTYEKYANTIDQAGDETTPEELDAFLEEIKSKFDKEKRGDEWHLSLYEMIKLEQKIHLKKTELESK